MSADQRSLRFTRSGWALDDVGLAEVARSEPAGTLPRILAGLDCGNRFADFPCPEAHQGPGVGQQNDDGDPPTDQILLVTEALVRRYQYVVGLLLGEFQ